MKYIFFILVGIVAALFAHFGGGYRYEKYSPGIDNPFKQR